MPINVARQTYPFTLPELPYAYDALEPHMDTQTLRLHHHEHHAAYVTKLNEALAPRERLHRIALAQLLRSADELPDPVRDAVRHNGGGHLNHDFYWNSLTPAPAREPRGALADALAAQFGSFGQFRTRFTAAATAHFASGWVALALAPDLRTLEIADLHDHDTLESRGRIGLFILDVWEHAYYLEHQNRRPEFITAFWNVVNWAFAEVQFERSLAAR